MLLDGMGEYICPYLLDLLMVIFSLFISWIMISWINSEDWVAWCCAA